MGWSVHPSKIYHGRYALHTWGHHSDCTRAFFGQKYAIVTYLRETYPNDDMLYCTDPQEGNEFGDDYVCDAMITEEQRMLIELKFR
jgi:hypothetical protein